MATCDHLRTTPEIRAVFDARTSAGGRLLVVHGRRQSQPTAGRVAIIAGRRVGGAVQRNRAKRRLRAAVRHVGLPPGSDMVVTARAGVLAAPYDAILNDLRRHLAQVATRIARS